MKIWGNAVRILKARHAEKFPKIIFRQRMLPLLEFQKIEADIRILNVCFFVPFAKLPYRRFSTNFLNCNSNSDSKKNPEPKFFPDPESFLKFLNRIKDNEPKRKCLK